MQAQTQRTDSSIDPAEVEQFSRIAEQWWDPKGKFKPLHDINPLRIGYIRDHVCRHFGKDGQSLKPFSGLSLLDIGCGGGLISEPMARLDASVTGIDASEKNITVASLHAQQGGLSIDYRANTAEYLTARGEQYNIVLALEIVEHVVDPRMFIGSCSKLVKPGGLLVMSTINRTLKSLAMAKIGAEYILRLVPRGTHDWNKFIRPSEMVESTRINGMDLVELRGMVINPLRWQWRLSETDLDVNYLMVAKKPA
jgi:2-polyprenyl-6-hydroxyphenyl methylase/3-demethylubiquinone-9 3-methyltransferase